MPGTVVWLDENGKREDPKKEVVKVEELGGIAGEVAKAEAKAIVLDLVEEETKQASSTAPGVAASSQTPPAATSTGVAIKLEPSRMAGPPPAFVKQIVDRVEEEKRDEIAGPRPDGKVHVLVGTDEIQAAKAGPAFIKFYAPWFVLSTSRDGAFAYDLASLSQVRSLQSSRARFVPRTLSPGTAG